MSPRNRNYRSCAGEELIRFFGEIEATLAGQDAQSLPIHSLLGLGEYYLEATNPKLLVSLRKLGDIASNNVKDQEPKSA